MSLEQRSVKRQRTHFERCCQHFELALSHFGYQVEVVAYTNEQGVSLLYVVEVAYQEAKRPIFTAMTLEEFTKKMELMYQLYLYAKTHACDLETALETNLPENQQLLAIQVEIDDLLNWQDFVIEQAAMSAEFMTHHANIEENRTIH